jgi:hypothetical protein
MIPSIGIVVLVLGGYLLSSGERGERKEERFFAQIHPHTPTYGRLFSTRFLQKEKRKEPEVEVLHAAALHSHQISDDPL